MVNFSGHDFWPVMNFGINPLFNLDLDLINQGVDPLCGR